MKSTFRPVSCEKCECKSKGIFCDLDDPGLSEISHHKVMNTYKKGQTIFFQGNPPFGLYCINQGKIKITKTAQDGKESLLRIAGPGDVLGHRSLFSQENYSATATVLEDSAICFLDKKFIYTALKEQPTISLNLIQKLSKEMGSAEARGASMSQKNVRERLAELLLSLHKSYGIQEGNRSRLDVKLTRDEMASMIGTASETVIRFISEFKEEGIIAQEGKVLYILDHEKLVDFANLSF